MENLTQGEKLAKKLLFEPVNCFKNSNYSQDEVFNFSEDYKTFLNNCKTERECVNYSVSLAKQSGFVPLESLDTLKPGDKVYSVNRGKGIILAIIGDVPITEGINLVGAHVDSPRLDLKPNPLYENNELAFLKTHYYGGIKKYQWTTIPLSIHGTVITKSCRKVDFVIGEEENDPVFTITDLLPHLGVSQMNKKMTEAIPGEKLNVLVGSIPISDEKVKEKVKLNTMKILNEKYSIVESDFLSAEIEVVPAFKARDIGFDRGLVGAYGQDDRVCAYTALRGILDLNSTKKTAVCLLVDKEEIGSVGNTGMQSRFFEDTMAKICYKSVNDYNDIVLRDTFNNSKCLSADVGAALDPNYPDVNEPNNTAYLNRGILIMKYTGSRGKSSSSDANSEFMFEIKKLFEDNNIVWQTGELGKIDEGGGGTIAQFVANLSIDTIDCGVPLLSMHSPFEIASKMDIYMAYKAYSVFYKN